MKNISIRMLPLPVFLFLTFHISAQENFLQQRDTAQEVTLQLYRTSRPDDMELAILTISGAQDLESLDEEVMERYRELASRPVAINQWSKSRLLSSGLFSSYQVASILDYIERNGDILSPAELALVDGFSRDYVEALRPFLSFWSKSPPGALQQAGSISNSLTMKAAAKSGNWSYGGRYVISASNWEAAAVARTTYSSGPWIPSNYGFYAVLYGRKHLGKFIMGDFNARFGQGLSLWSGYTMSGFSGSSSFSRRPSGISPSSSYSSSNYRGLAADLSFGHLTVTGLIAFTGLRNWMENASALTGDILPALNMAWYGRVGQISLTAFHAAGSSQSTKIAADTRLCIKGTDLFGEVSYDATNCSIAGMTGASISINSMKLSFVGRVYPASYDTFGSAGIRTWTNTSDEYGLALGMEWKNLIFSADLAEKSSTGKAQLKLLLSRWWTISEHIILKTRISQRCRNYGLSSRTDLRADVCQTYGKWLLNVRGNALFCDDMGLLGYAEAGRKSEVWAVYLRGTLFRIDDWDDRIYSYERDAPGNFTVPAYYRRGYALSAYISFKGDMERSKLKFYLRGSLISYPWLSPGMTEKKSGSAELKIQLNWTW